jgi:hypothetical protein
MYSVSMNGTGRVPTPSPAFRSTQRFLTAQTFAKPRTPRRPPSQVHPSSKSQPNSSELISLVDDDRVCPRSTPSTIKRDLFFFSRLLERMIPASARADWWGSAEGNASTLVENARFLKLWPEGREGHHAGVEMPLVWFGLGSYPCHIFHPYWETVRRGKRVETWFR